MLDEMRDPADRAILVARADADEGAQRDRVRVCSIMFRSIQWHITSFVGSFFTPQGEKEPTLNKNP
jgi:hypothetical protein